jgi:hypothetical protein
MPRDMWLDQGFPERGKRPGRWIFSEISGGRATSGTNLTSLSSVTPAGKVPSASCEGNGPHRILCRLQCGSLLIFNCGQAFLSAPSGPAAADAL